MHCTAKAKPAAPSAFPTAPVLPAHPMIGRRVEMAHGWAVTLTRKIAEDELDMLADEAATDSFILFNAGFDKAGDTRYQLSILYLNADSNLPNGGVTK
tara:strand:- start:495 stop:788 length:294 start_codon:yes stop_codon:yes gene_type:complete